MSKLEHKNIVDLPDVMKVSDVMKVMRCSQSKAYKIMDEVGGTRNGIRRIFKTNFIGWLKSQGYKEEEVHEADPVIKMFTNADNRNICTVVDAGIPRRAGAHQSQGVSH